MAFSLQSLKDFAYRRYSLLGISAALGAGALLTLGYCNRQKTRDMSSFPNLTNSLSITGKLLTPDMFAILKDKCTAEGYDIDNLIGSRQHNLSANFTSELRTPRDCWWATTNTVKTKILIQDFSRLTSAPEQ